MAAFARRRTALIALPLLLIGAGAGTFGVIHAQQHGDAVTAEASPTVDTRLILHPQHVPISGTLAGGDVLSGSIYPGIPYRANTIQITVRRGGHALAAGGGASFRLSMVGMRMLPIKATLRPAGQSYSGSVWLPMFGTYQGPVTISTPSGTLTGTIRVTAPLPGI